MNTSVGYRIRWLPITTTRACLILGLFLSWSSMAEDVVTKDGTRYEAIRWGRIIGDRVTIYHRGGVATETVTNLPPDVLKRFGLTAKLNQNATASSTPSESASRASTTPSKQNTKSNEAKFTILHSFKAVRTINRMPVGEAPGGSLTLAGTTLYGITDRGGVGNHGAIFKINTDGSGYSIVYSAARPEDLLLNSVPESSPMHRISGDSLTVGLESPLTQSGATLYGVMGMGGAQNGAVFKINTDGTGFTTLHRYTGTDGGKPTGSLTLSGTTLYGVTHEGGADHNGVVFKLNTEGSGYAVLHHFAGGAADGYWPEGSLTLSGTTLYGVTSMGGAGDGGVIFKLNTDGAGYTILHEFTAAKGDGASPNSLVMVGSSLYGTTCSGGTNDNGVIFKINTSGSDYTVLHRFAGGSTDGKNPNVPLTLSGMTLYGTTQWGGENDKGVFFKINVDGSDYTILHHPTLAEGPCGSLALSGTTLYGVARDGGAEMLGAVFALPLPAHAAEPQVTPGSRESQKENVAILENAPPTQTSHLGVNSLTVNSLGMKFVPVPRTEVLFCIWLTRVQDFEAFVRATGYVAVKKVWSPRADGWKQRGDTWKNPGFAQGPTHPVCGVNWEDAVAFCQWLTQKERALGTIAQDQEYRLPKDWEWSLAVGLDEPKEGLPAGKDRKTTGVYPWGSEWPPPIGAGNFADEESKDGNTPVNWPVIRGYNDGFSRTSPVGSFKANQYGLFDMSGNLWEWCDDLSDGAPDFRVLRGGSWRDGESSLLLSSTRYYNDSVHRSGNSSSNRGVDLGFRVVLTASGEGIASETMTKKGRINAVTKAVVPSPPSAPAPITPVTATNLTATLRVATSNNSSRADTESNTLLAAVHNGNLLKMEKLIKAGEKPVPGSSMEYAEAVLDLAERDPNYVTALRIAQALSKAVPSDDTFTNLFLGLTILGNFETAKARYLSNAKWKKQEAQTTLKTDAPEKAPQGKFAHSAAPEAGRAMAKRYAAAQDALRELMNNEKEIQKIPTLSEQQAILRRQLKAPPLTVQIVAGVRYLDDDRNSTAATTASGRGVRQQPSNTLPEGVAPDIECETLNAESLSLYRQGRYDRAAVAAQKALQIAEQSVGPYHPVVAVILNNLATLYSVQGLYAQAEPLHKRALAIREKALDPNHPHVAESLNNLAMLYQHQRQYAQAEPLFKRALAIQEKACGPEHPDLVPILNNLAMLYSTQSKDAQAEPLYKRALAIQEKALGPKHPDLVPILNNLAMLYSDRSQYELAESLCKRALAIQETTLDSDHPSVAQSLNTLAMMYSAQKLYAQAEPLYKRALAIQEKALGPNHPDEASILENMATLYRITGREREAEPLEQRAKAIREMKR